MAGTENAHPVPCMAAGTEDPAAGARPAGGAADPGVADTEAADEALLAELRRVAVDADPVPERVLQAARLAITYRDPDGELAQLIAVSTTEYPGTGPAGDASYRHAEGMRGEAGALRSGGPSERPPLMLSFVGGGVHIDLEVTRRGRVIDVVGQLIGAAEAGCTIEDADGRRDVELDGLGRFIVEGLRSGPIRLRCRSTDGGAVTTAWTTV